jgi:hypothetical protein
MVRSQAAFDLDSVSRAIAVTRYRSLSLTYRYVFTSFFLDLSATRQWASAHALLAPMLVHANELHSLTASFRGKTNGLDLAINDDDLDIAPQKLWPAWFGIALATELQLKWISKHT